MHKTSNVHFVTLHLKCGRIQKYTLFLNTFGTPADDSKIYCYILKCSTKGCKNLKHSLEKHEIQAIELLLDMGKNNFSSGLIDPHFAF